MIGRRMRPVFGVLLLGGLVCLVRLFQVQVLEHEVWAGEAARLVSYGELIPYERGSILDTHGKVLAKDKETHHLILVYRDFRRGHALGQVAHARSLLEGRAVPLAEAHVQLFAWARELVDLSPADLDRFARGEGLLTDTLLAPPATGDEARALARRAADVRFYLRRLLDLSPREWVGLSKGLDEEERERSYLELAAAIRPASPGAATDGPAGAEALWWRLEERLLATEEHLVRLAERLDWGASEADGDELRTPLGRLVDELELSRRWVEDAAASKLFAEAAGFSPGRLAPHTLRAFFDLNWIRHLLAWDEERVYAWAKTVRAGWLDSWRDGYALPHLLASLSLDPTRDPGPDDVLDHLAAVFLSDGGLELALDGQGPPWREIQELAVFGQLAGMFEADVPDEVSAIAAEALPFSRSPLRELVPRPEFRWNLIDAALTDPPAQPRLGKELCARLEGRARSESSSLTELALELVDDWERTFQSRVMEALLAVRRSADVEDECTPEGRLRFSRGRQERAVERADYYLKDYGHRPRAMFSGEPDYEVIYLLSRYEEFYPGFEVREARERVYPVGPGDPARLAGKLLGHVSSVSAFDMQSQRAELQRLRELRDVRRRSDTEELELVRLVGRVLQNDEVKGVSGLEGFLDPELVGRNGYFETHGLDDLQSGRSAFLSRPEDGSNVHLTLDATIQRAAERTLRNPQAVADEKYDYQWQAAPVGAIVWASLDGDVIAAASEPGEGSRVPEGTPGQRGVVIDRTLRIPDFQPPGSVFKPFVAAWALESAGLDPARTVLCGPIKRGGSGYADVRCHRVSGHGEVNLEAALVQSCNAYFAWLGETLDADGFRSLAKLFGFGRPSGIKLAPNVGGLRTRTGFIEDAPPLFTRGMSEFQRRLAGNGLGLVEATPVQLARATAGIATGWLPSMRLVKTIGDQAFPQAPPQRLDLSSEHLDFVRHALRDVANSSAGTAFEALAAEHLGFRVAVKTGSADIRGRNDEVNAREHTVRKHTWVAGWVPEQDPVAVFVIFMHDTASTSSHGAVYLARQFLLQPEVLSWLQERGVLVGKPAAEEQGR